MKVMLPLVAATVLLPASSFAPRATLVAIPIVKGIPPPHPYAISPDGAVVVGGFSPAEGFTYRVASRSLVRFAPNGAHVYPNAVADRGKAIVGVAKGAFLYIAGERGGLRTLAALPHDVASVASGLSADGGTAVGYSQSPGGGFRAVRWRAGETRALQLIEGYPDMHARAVSRGGARVVGAAYTSERAIRAFRWTEFVGSGLLTIPDWASDSAAEAMTPDGRLAVGSISSRRQTLAARWDVAADRITTLPLLPGASTGSGLAIDPDGRWVGGFSGERACLWDAAGRALPLQSFLKARRADVAGWSFEQIVGLGRSGRKLVLTGWGARNGKSLGFVAAFWD